MLQPEDSSLDTKDKMWGRAEPEGCPKMSTEPPDSPEHGEQCREQPDTQAWGDHTHTKPPRVNNGVFSIGLPWPCHTGNCEYKRER